MHFQLSESFNSQFCSQVYQPDRWSESNSERERIEERPSAVHLSTSIFIVRTEIKKWRDGETTPQTITIYLIWFGMTSISLPLHVPFAYNLLLSDGLHKLYRYQTLPWTQRLRWNFLLTSTQRASCEWAWFALFCRWISTNDTLHFKKEFEVFLLECRH